jgi:GT2 family glycosyltransferase
MNNISNICTIVIPTHNRNVELNRCIYSIREIFPTMHIIIGDNSSLSYPILKIDNMYNVSIINTRNHEGNMHIAYKNIIE